jgi:TonB family protein
MSKGRPKAEATLADLDTTPLASETVQPIDEPLGELDELAAAEAAASEPAASEPVAAPSTRERGDRVNTDGVAVPATPEEVEAQIRDLVNARADTLEARYEDELAELRQQLEEAKLAQEKAAEEQKKASVPAKPAVQEPAAATTTSTPAGQQPTQQAASRPADTAGSSAATQAPATGTATRSPAEPEPEQAPPTQPAKPAPKPVAVGDLVEPGPGVAPPRMTERPSPRYPPSARRLGKNAIVQLRLLVDENGRVARVETVGNKAGFGFDDAAIDAANRTAWQAATKDGVRVKMWVDLKIEFRP